jgi:hypothetical protein
MSTPEYFIIKEDVAMEQLFPLPAYYVEVNNFWEVLIYEQI